MPPALGYSRNYPSPPCGRTWMEFFWTPKTLWKTLDGFFFYLRKIPWNFFLHSKPCGRTWMDFFSTSEKFHGIFFLHSKPCGRHWMDFFSASKKFHGIFFLFHELCGWLLDGIIFCLKKKKNPWFFFLHSKHPVKGTGWNFCSASPNCYNFFYSPIILHMYHVEDIAWTVSSPCKIFCITRMCYL